MLKLAMLLSCSCVLIDAGSVSSIAAENVPAELVGTWLAEDIGGGGVIDFLQTTLEINDDGTYSGFAGCNSYTGTFGLEGTAITFGPAGSTRKMCPPAIMDQETKFFEALKSGLSWKIEDTKLVLAKPDSSLAVRLAAHTVSAELILNIPGAQTVDRQTAAFDCGGKAVAVEYINAGPVSLVTLAIGEEFIVASNVISGSGAKYMGGQYVWWTKGNEATLFDTMKGEDDPGVACAKTN
ncbi:META domain-containing protein [Pararhizobium sp. BT-229]|uniref:META domain-containing protein n=1 Tax=Pararhizobium sp. BT-229 TaxID=2986923 RepID=UPI0021F7DBB7|nr:META domain-containing protein [Pararhizobium sp. BT-229]MCV9965990.1 META domain-containing protein [Pararhizobium sp. BT-229]